MDSLSSSKYLPSPIRMHGNPNRQHAGAMCSCKHTMSRAIMSGVRQVDDREGGVPRKRKGAGEWKVVLRIKR